MKRKWTGATLFLLGSLFSLPLFAGALEGVKQIYLLDKQGAEHYLGSVQFDSNADEVRYTLHMDHARFRDYFLSMKEMKCLEGPELMCHLPYPYTQPRTVQPQDLSWLSHDLLFMFKKPDEFGANFWNGIYYDLRIEKGVIRGQAQAVDLNLLASPPADLHKPPMTEGERDEIDRSKRWLPELLIR